MSDAQNPEMTAATAEERPIPPSRPVLLREAREAAGLHIAALAAALKVPVRKLEALESGRYEELPDLTFARALASSACRHLKIDPAPVLGQIPAAITPVLGDSPQTINAPFKAAGDAPLPGALSWAARPVPLIVAVLLVAALAVYFWPSAPPVASGDDLMPPSASEGQGASEPTVAQTPVEPAAAPAPAVTEPAVQPAVAEPVSSAAPASTSSVPATASPVAVTAPVASVPSTATPSAATPAAGASLMTLTASGESWVEVVNGRGETVLQRMLKAGDSVDFSSAPPYAVVVGRADAVQVSVRGQPLDITPYARNSVARFEVK